MSNYGAQVMDRTKPRDKCLLNSNEMLEDLEQLVAPRSIIHVSNFFAERRVELGKLRFEHLPKGAPAAHLAADLWFCFGHIF